MAAAVILTCSGLELTKDECDVFREIDPFGFILFANNIENAEQVKELTDSLRSCIKREGAPILIDQEGGRVTRLNQPEWRKVPPAKAFGSLVQEKNLDIAKRASWINGRLIANDLFQLGINVNCAPVLDLTISGAHDVIGDRSFGGSPDVVVPLARAFARGLIAGGVLPMIKHVPGHGRAMADSHKELPRIDLPREELEKTDFMPFKGLSDMPMAMTAHILFPQLDPEQPATTSSLIISEIVRGYIGFKGLIISDDVTMSALSGSYRARASATRSAGCDVVLHCSSDITQMKEIAEGSGQMSSESIARFAQAREIVPDSVEKANSSKLIEELAELMEN